MPSIESALDPSKTFSSRFDIAGYVFHLIYFSSGLTDRLFPDFTLETCEFQEKTAFCGLDLKSGAANIAIVCYCLMGSQ